MATVRRRADEDVDRLVQKVEDRSYEPAELANGAVELLNEVSASKITGEEDRYSHTDLSTSRPTSTGRRRRSALLAPAAAQAQRRAGRARSSARFDAVDAALAPYKRGDAFVAYDTVDARRERRKLSQAVDALAEPLSKVGAPSVQARWTAVGHRRGP